MFDDVAYRRLVDSIQSCFISSNSNYTFEAVTFYDSHLCFTNDVCFKIYHYNKLYASVYFIYLEDNSYFVFAKKHMLNFYESLVFSLSQLELYFKPYGIDLLGLHLVDSLN